MSDHPSSLSDPDGRATSAKKVVRWRHGSDGFEALVRRANGRPADDQWVTALPLPRSHTDEDEDTRRAIAAGFDAYGQYHEVVVEADVERVELVGRLGREVACSLGRTLGTSAVRQPGGEIRICLWLSTDPWDEA